MVAFMAEIVPKLQRQARAKEAFRANAIWLRDSKNRTTYEGQWVALLAGSLITAAHDLELLFQSMPAEVDVTEVLLVLI